MRRVLIIGATSAIAQATAKHFAQAHDALFLLGRDADKLMAMADDLKVRGAKQADYAVLDVNAFAEHASVLDTVYEKLDGLDTVLIAHGTLDDQLACQQDFAATQQALNTNFLSVVSFLTLIANRFEQQHYGSIAVISSVAGDRGRQSNYVYGTAKGALNIFLQGLRNRLYPANVSVLTVKPGFVDTPMTAEFKKGALWAQPDTVGKAIYRGIQTGKNSIYVPWFWRVIMTIITAIPEFIFKRMKL